MKNKKQKAAEALKQQTINKLKQPGFTDHRWPISRRDFVKLGLLQGAGLMMMPSLATLFAQRAQATALNHIPFLVIDLVGGAAMPGNFLATDTGQELLKDYTQHGWDPRQSGAIDKTFGLPMAASASQMLRGIKQNLDAKWHPHFKMASVITMTTDDTTDNKISALGLIARAQNGGQFFKAGLGNRNSTSGGYSQTDYIQPVSHPIFVTSGKSLTEAASVKLSIPLNDTSKKDYIQNMNEQDLEFLRKNSHSKSAQQILETILKKLSTLNPTSFDPASDSHATRIFSIGQSTTEREVEAVVAHNLLNNLVGPSCISIKECDYHDGTQNTGDVKDLEIGQLIGRVLALASARGTPLLIQIITDGGVYSDPGTRNWRGDSRLHTMSVLGIFNPQKPPELIDNKFQLGAYTTEGIIDQNTIVGSNNDMAMKVLLANYLHLTGRLGEFAQFVGNSALTTKQLEELLLFA